MKVAFVTNFCPHYRVKTFEILARYYDVDFLFFSEGRETYWDKHHGISTGAFNYEYLSGFYLTQKLRVVPSLVPRLWQGNYDVIVMAIAGRFAVPATFLIARLKGIPFVAWTGAWSHPRTFFHRLTFPLTRYLYEHANAIAVYGLHVRRYLVSLGVKDRHIFEAWHAADNVVYNRLVSREEVDLLRAQLGLGYQQQVVLFVGRLEEGKGLPHLVEALAHLGRSDVVLVLVGAGSEEETLERLSARRNVSIVFAGYVPNANLCRYYALADIFVLPSVTTPTFREPWGLVINEAMNQGVPVVATDAVGAAVGGLVKDGYTGIVVPERDAEALAQAIGRLLDSRELRERMGRAAREAIAGWDNERMVSGFRVAIDYAYRSKGCQ